MLLDVAPFLIDTTLAESSSMATTALPPAS
jgi:hypothetical protein